MRAPLVLLSIFTTLHAHNTSQDIWINVIIHGTVGLRSQLNFSTFLNLMKDQVDDTPYKRVVSQIRNDPYFFKIQPIQELGFHPITMNCKQHCSAASVFASLLEKTMQANSNTQNYYYTYGWSGLLSHSHRYKDAQLLYACLQKEMAAVQKKHPHKKIHLRLMCYSHGGSVALHLAQVNRDSSGDKFTLDELILLGTPIQRETDYLVHEPFFKKIYNFYSKKDLIQRLDCFSFNRFFSNRKFNKQCLHDKLVQVEIRVMGNKYEHSNRYAINRSPTHTELWFFGWTLTSYRKKFISYPIPLGAFTPRLTQLLAACIPHAKHAVISLYPDGMAQVREKGKHGVNNVRWIEPKELQNLQTYALQHAPANITHAEHLAHIKSAHQATLAGLEKLQYKHEKKYKKSQKYRRCLCGIGAYDIP